MNRRTFLKAAPLVSAAPLFVPAQALGQQGRPSANGRITMGVIGTGNRGTDDMLHFLKDDRVQVVAVCDVNRQTPGYWNGVIGGREPAKQYVDWHYAKEKRSGIYKGCDAYEDFRQLLERKDIDTIVTALPDQWHALVAIAAVKAGKDVYGEKPLSLTIREGRAMSDAVRENNRIFQTGSQQRSDARFRKACELVRNGRIGKIHTVRCGLPGGVPDLSGDGDRKDPEPIPEGFNYDMWLGPAPEAPYCPARTFVNYRWIFDYSGGQITDWGGHHPDIAQWALDMDHSGPIAIKNGKAVFAKDKLWNTATDFYFEAHYENGVKLIVSNHERGGVTFQGEDGWIWVNRGAIESNPASVVQSEIGPNEIHLYKSENHYGNFIDCVKSREQTIAPCETGHRSITIAHLGNISLRLGRDLKWDPKREEIIGDDEASKMLSRPMRGPWKLS